MLWHILLVSCMVCCQAWTVSLTESKRPFLTFNDNLGHLSWSRGALHQGVVSKFGVRVSDNRVRVLTSPSSVKSAHITACHPVEHALCEVRGNGLKDIGIAEGSLIFPTSSPVLVSSNSKLLETGKGCVDGSGRHVNTTLDRYDVSACDAFDSILDVVYYDGMVGVTRVHFSTTLYGLSGLLVVITIVVITQNLAADMISKSKHNASTSVHTKYCLILGCALILTSCILPGIVNPKTLHNYDFPFNFVKNLFYPVYTQNDQLFFVLVLSSLVMQVIVISYEYFFNKERGEKLHSVNFMVTCVLLSIVSTHGTVETFLTAPMAFVLMFRTFFKIFTISWQRGVVEPLFIALDSVIIVQSILFGTIPIFQNQIEGLTTATMLFLVSFFLALGAAEANELVQNKKVSTGP